MCFESPRKRALNRPQTPQGASDGNKKKKKKKKSWLCLRSLRLLIYSGVKKKCFSVLSEIEGQQYKTNGQLAKLQNTPASINCLEKERDLVSGYSVSGYSLQGNLYLSMSVNSAQNNVIKVLSVWVFWFFLGPHPWHIEVPRLGVESELQLPAGHSHSHSRS